MSEEVLQEKASVLKDEVRTAASERAKISGDNRKLIDEFRALLAQAKQMREARDAKREEGRKLVELKKPLYDRLEVIRKRLDEIAAERQKLEGTIEGGYEMLRRKADMLEWKLQTEALSPMAEKALSKQIRTINEMLKPASQIEKNRGEAKLLLDEKRNVVWKLRDIDAHIDGAFAAANDLHEKAVKASERADAISKRIGEKIEEIGEKRDKEQELRSELGEVIGTLKEQDRAVIQARGEAERKEKQDTMARLKQEAEVVREKLKTGGKISLYEMQVLAQMEDSGN